MANTGQTSTTSGPETDKDLAQAFTTGRHTGGYRLTSVKAKIIGNSSAPTYTAHIFKANSQTGLPTGDSLGTLTNPSSLATSGIVVWTTTGAGIDLDANTGYLFVVDVSTVGNVAFALTNSDDEDANVASGWSIDNVYALRTGIANTIAWGRPTGSPAMQIELHGFAKTVRTEFAPVQTAGALVSNSNLQTDTTFTSSTFTGDLGQGFTTGSAPGGYKLTGLTLGLSGTGAKPVFSAEIRTSEPASDSHGSRAAPTDTVVGTLTATGALGVFTAVGGIDLDPDTTYFVVLDVTATSQTYRWFERREAYDQVAGAVGWRIEDYAVHRVAGAWGRTLNANLNVVRRLAIDGYVKDAYPPDAPGRPTVSSVAGKGGQLAVSWNAPANNGSAILDYDLRYFKGSSDPTNEADWVDEGFGGRTGIPAIGATPGTLTNPVIISGLAPASTYRVQVRAANAAGEGPWSDSRSRTTAAAGANNAPRLLERKSGDANNNCQVKTNTTTPSATINAPSGTLVSLTPVYNRQFSGDTAEWPDACTTTTGTRAVPWFDDRDAETLAYTFSYTLPDSVRFVSETPRIVQSTNEGEKADRLFTRLQTAGAAKNIRLDITATDPQGASASTHIILQSASSPNSVGPPRLESPGLVRFGQNKQGSAVLPAATGGDNPHYGYLYHVSGLPPGLSFDRETRTVSGTPTTAGTWTATYTADDFDGHYSRKDSPTAADTADAASQTFTVRVDPAAGSTPTIQGLWGVSLPAHSSGNNNIYDTYVRGDRIVFHVQYDRPVAASLPKTNSRVSLRMHLGPDNAGTTKRANLESIVYGGRVLRFVYEVQAGDTDTDGVWVQTASATNKTVVFLANDATLVDAETGVAAGRTLSGLPTAGGQLPGAERAKVDGSVTTPSGARPVAAEIDGKTLKVTFSSNLDNTGAVDTAMLATELAVQGAGDVQGETVLYQHPDYVSFATVTHEGATVTQMVLTLSQPARPGQRVTLFYEGSRLMSGTARVPRFGQLEVTNVTGGTASVAPAPVYGSVAGNSLTVRFSRALAEDSAPTAGAFQVWTRDRNNDGRPIWGRATATTSVSGDTVTIPLAGSVRADEGARVSYFKPASGPVLKDRLLHTEVASWQDFPVYSNHDVTPPGAPGMVVVQHPSVTTASTVTLYFDKALDTGSVPAAANFTASAAGSTVTTTSYSVTNNSVIFGANAASTADTTVWRVVYDPDATGGTPIRDEAGNAVAGFTVQETAATATKPAIGTANATVDGATLRLLFGGGYVDPASIPAASAFTFHDTESPPNALDIGIDAIWADSNQLFLLLENPVPPCAGATVTNNIAFRITYTKPSTNPIQGLAGAGQADAFSSVNVQNRRTDRCRRIR